MPAASKETEVPETDTLETISPSTEHKVYVFGPDQEFTLVQKPLGFFGKMELFAVLGGAVDKALASGTSLTAILDDVPAVRGESLSAEDFKDADQFIRVIARLAVEAPDILKDLYLVALNVPRGRREYVRSVMELHEDEGGLSDAQGVEIIDTFVAQNWDVMVDFFKDQILPLVGRIGQKISPTPAPSASSKRSKATRPATQKA